MLSIPLTVLNIPPAPPCQKGAAVYFCPIPSTGAEGGSPAAGELLLLPAGTAGAQSWLRSAATGKGRKAGSEQGPEFLAIGNLQCGAGKGFSSSWRVPGLVSHTTAALRDEAKGGTSSAMVGAWESHPVPGFVELEPMVFLLLQLLKKPKPPHTWKLGASWAIPGFASIPGGFVGDKAPRHSLLAIKGLDLEGQPLLKRFLQQHRCLLPFPVVRQEGTEIPPLVRLPWAGVANLRTGKKAF